ncbi:flagellar hook-basal body complex protein FliE [Tatumella punctata]|uniref:Flagellar hook-basal body complex protein FliE n=1 Tax=Tatumella punctata TaxID=399969 RepID=A0ABW1VQF4_9GAMM
MSSLIQQVSAEMSVMAGIAGGKEKAAEQGQSFSGLLRSALGNISQHYNRSQADSEKFDAGDSHISLNDLMLEMQKATISLQMGVQVRNKLVNAYTDIMNMSV